jgi:hypothetical protein
MTNFQFKFKRGLKADLEAVNPLLLQGEPCFELDTYCLKIGDGTNSYNNLPYVNDIEHIEEEEIKKIVEELLPKDYGCHWGDITS